MEIYVPSFTCGLPVCKINIDTKFDYTIPVMQRKYLLRYEKTIFGNFSHCLYRMDQFQENDEWMQEARETRINVL